MLRRILPLLAVAVCAAMAQKYDGPRPPKPDLPYLKHAGTLIPTEAGEAGQEKKKDDTLYTINGANSTARTPLASPVFLFQAEKITPERLQLYKLESKNGRRELLLRSKKPPKPILVEVTRLSPDNIFKIEVDESLEPGEYSFSPDDSNQVFCFQVY
jgi:hypothetical protein